MSGLAEEFARWAAVYRSSAYGFVGRDGVWRWFALDGVAPTLAGNQVELSLITAWNPNSVELSRAQNDLAQAALEAALRAAGIEFHPAAGASLPGVTPSWREEGCVLFDVEREAARAWGARWGQRALVRLDAEGAELIFCADGRGVRCGVRALDAPSRE